MQTLIARLVFNLLPKQGKLILSIDRTNINIFMLGIVYKGIAFPLLFTMLDKIVSFNKPEKAQEEYKQRWQIEMCFKAMTSSGFGIEKTHLQDIEKNIKIDLTGNDCFCLVL